MSESVVGDHRDNEADRETLIMNLNDYKINIYLVMIPNKILVRRFVVL